MTRGRERRVHKATTNVTKQGEHIKETSAKNQRINTERLCQAEIVQDTVHVLLRIHIMSTAKIFVLENMKGVDVCFREYTNLGSGVV